MKLTFHIHYHASWGESLLLTIDAHKEVPIELCTHDGFIWEGEVELPETQTETILTYRYSVIKSGKCIRTESGCTPHAICLNHPKGAVVSIEDSWRELPQDAYLFSSAFYKGVEATRILPTTKHNETITFRAACPALHSQKLILGIAGNQNAFGNWKDQGALPMQEVSPNEWMVTIPRKGLISPIEYKFVAICPESGQTVRWEEGKNREIRSLYHGNKEAYILPLETIKLHQEVRKVAGTAIPVFALRSEGSAGVGDFGDLKKMVDWAVQTGQQAVQILPINDTTITHTWSDSYPYNSISIYAFHPMYIDLRAVDKLKDSKKMTTFEAERIKLNALAQIDYEEVNALKRSYLEQLYQQEGETVLGTAAFKYFFEENKHWLLPYGAFCYLRDLYGTPDFSLWPAHKVYKPECIASLCEPGSPSYEKIAFNYYIQYLLHIQLLETANYARERGVIFKGDIPIGISRNSVEAWVEPYYFNMNGQAGAPPDAFSANGQNWGFPTYNWEIMEEDNYQWWKKRFAKMAEYFTAYRIDHILGFFRIWEIPTHSVHGLLGQFVPALPMSVEEIQGYGFHFQKDFMTLPFITEELLHRYFGEKVNFVKETFVENSHYDVYRMRPGFETQRQVEHYFEGKTDQESINLREGIYALISNVLFVPDRKDNSCYHPRISAQQDYTYSRLTWAEKEAFNRLYNDYYYKRHNQFWYEQAMQKLPTLTQSTHMLVCGEDLGMVPDCVPWVMDQLQVISLEIERMPKDPTDTFGKVWNYPYLSVCTISTHDMNNLRGWWEEDAQVTAHYYYHVLGYGGEVPKVASGKICEEVINKHLTSPSLLTILAFQDWLSIDESIREPQVEMERINVPANPRHYWRYRMHLTLEELMKKEAFNQQVKKLITAAGR
ncbi:MAG: 4-alpha-glucanotransferase [Phocaeicola sp.]